MITNFAWKPIQLPYILPGSNGNAVWFRIARASLNSDLKFDSPAIFIKNSSGGFKVFTDNQMLAGISNSYPEQWNIISVPRDQNYSYLYFEAISKDKRNIGFQSGVLLGSENGFIREMIHTDMDYLVLGSFFTLIGFLIGVIFVFMRSDDRLPLFSLGFFAFCGGIFTLTLTHTKQLLLDNMAFWFYLNQFSFLLFPVGIAVFVDYVFGGRFRYIMRFLWVLNLLYAAYAGELLIRNPYTGLVILIPFYVLILIQLTVSILSVAQDSLKGDREAIIFNAGIVIFGIALLYDIGRGLISIITGSAILKEFSDHYTFHFGMLVFLISLALILTLRFARNRDDLEEYSMELENKVENRTKELLKERNKLKVRNDIMESELVMAREIQFQLIPSKSPSPDISFYYKPMDQVGGDFYDFIEFQDSKSIGIFLSDVSGHGVPAAFITSMIKSFIQRSREIQSDPAALLSYLNDALFNQTGGNFVTAFYGIYDQKTQDFVYSNAGHNLPYVIARENGPPEIIDSVNKGIPLAVIKNEELAALNKTYSNSKIKLHKNSKLFLYTDGFVEAVNIDDKEVNEKTKDFESAVFSDAAFEYRDLPAEDFVRNLVNRLVQFRGSDKFEDDVCMICVDVG
jgi:serine phosphatase RsbU (regulator of sigma subunit)